MAFDNLTLLDEASREPVDAVTARRNRLLRQIDRQQELIRKFVPGRPLRGRWFYPATDGSFHLSIKYGRKNLALAANKFGIRCLSIEELGNALEIASRHCQEGFFDTQMATFSNEIRQGFKKSQPNRQTGNTRVKSVG